MPYMKRMSQLARKFRTNFSCYIDLKAINNSGSESFKEKYSKEIEKTKPDQSNQV